MCWLRNDLRCHDNEALRVANSLADCLLPVYCFDPRHFKGTWHHGFPKTGPLRARFLAEAVADLSQRLAGLNSGLGLGQQILPKDMLTTIIRWCGEVKAPVSHLVYQREVTYEELGVEEELDQLCSSQGIQTVKIWGATLYHLQDIPFKQDKIPDTYTQFRKETETRSRVRPVLEMPAQLKPLPAAPLPPDLSRLPAADMLAVRTDTRTAFPFRGGETAALERLQSYLWDTDLVATYKETRNGLVGESYSTKFSPWLAVGCLSPRLIYKEIRRYEKERQANQSTYWVIFELLWRDYFRFVCLKFGDRIFYRSGILGKDPPWSADKQKFEQWAHGRTGVPFVDANMRELKETGWMSNRGRQNVASFLVKDLGLDWRLGAEWFESYLLDHDVCSNYGNWNYAAGIGNDPRENRKFNMIKQGLDYDPDGEFIRLWVPELAGLRGGKIHTPWTLSDKELTSAGIDLGVTYPKPMVVAPEWSRHAQKGPSSGGKGGDQRKGQQKGIDFYFKADHQMGRGGAGSDRPRGGGGNGNGSGGGGGGRGAGGSGTPDRPRGGGGNGNGTGGGGRGGGPLRRPPLRGGRIQF